jgi:YYY domain-containing protein
MGEAFVWWLTLELIGLAAFPVASVALRGLPDRGWAVSKMLGILLVGWLAYTLSMMQLAQFGRGLLLFALAALVALSAWILLHNNRAGWVELRSYLARPQVIRYIVVAESLFTFAFAAWAWWRAHDPEIFGLEKFMDFGFMNSIAISGTFPPNDMWLAGHSINYYYFGYVLMASLSLLSGVPTTIGYNLSNVTLFALTALGTFGVAFNIVTAVQERRASRRAVEEASAQAPGRVATRSVREKTVPAKGNGANGKPMPVRRTAVQQSRASSAPSATSLAVLEKDEGAQTGNGHQNGADFEPIEPIRGAPAEPAYAGGDDGALGRGGVGWLPYTVAVVAMLMVVAMGNLSVPFATQTNDRLEGNGFRLCFYCLDQARFNWWDPSRIIQDYRTVQTPEGVTKQRVGNVTINEFPGFSFLINDMHPHLMALPLTLLALSGALALARRKIRRGRSWLDGLPRGWAAWLSLFVIGLVIGSLYAANTWDYPTYMLLALIALGLPLLAHQREGEHPSGWRCTRPFIVQSALLVAIGLITFALFHLTFKSLVGGQPAPVPDDVRNIPLFGWIAERLSAFLLVNTADKTILGFVVIFGVHLLAILGWLTYEVTTYMRARREEGRLGGADWSLPGVLIVSLLLAFLLRFPLLGLLLPIAFTCFYLLWREPQHQLRGLVLGMCGIAATIGLSIEVFYLNDVFNDRSNTLFKFYYQLWLIWGLVTAYAAWRVLGSLFARHSEAPAPSPSRGRYAAPERVGSGLQLARGAAALWVFGLAFLVVSSLTWIIFGPLSKTGWNPQMRGLDGIAHLANSAPSDLVAIRWLRANATANDRILECCRDEYNNPGHAGRVSAYTGIPTLISWDGHEGQWRGGQPELLAELGPRRTIVNAIYQGAPPAHTAPSMLQTLQENGITYVFVGAVERGEPMAAGGFENERITPQAESLMREVLTEAFREGNTVIYRVPPAPVSSGGLR